MTDVRVERLTTYNEGDAEQLGRLMPFLSELFSDDPVDPELLDAIIHSPYHDQLVARLDGRIVGAATLSIVLGAAAGRKGRLEDFVTDATLQGKGIGGKVWDEMMRWCKEHEVGLEFTSRPSREAAHRFYHERDAVVRDTTVFHKDMPTK